MSQKIQTGILITLAMLLLCFTTNPASAAPIDVGPQVATYEGDTRGFWFTAPSDFIITRLGVPTDASIESFDVAVLRLPQVPSGPTTTFDTLFLSRNNSQNSMLTTNIAVSAGDVIGILGSRGANSTNSYGSLEYTTEINGSSVTLKRLEMQEDLRDTHPVDAVVSSPAGWPLGRVFFEISTSTIDVGPHKAPPYSGSTRGFWFTAPADFKITGLAVPNDASVKSSDVAVLRFKQTPPEFNTDPSTSDFDTLFLSRDNEQGGMLDTDIKISKGDIIGILGSRGADATNSYGPARYVTHSNGFDVTLTRLMMQDKLRSADPVSIGVYSYSPSNIGRISVQIGEPDPFPWAMFIPKKIVQLPNPQWTAKSGICCTVSNMTFTVTLDGITKSSTATPSSAEDCASSSISVEPFTETTSGYKSFSASVSGGCINDGSGTFSYTFMKGNAYTFTTYLDGTDVRLNVTSVSLAKDSLGADKTAKTKVFSLFSLEDFGSSLNGADSTGECATP